ncbi:metallophosphoesterase domain-containing protein [Niveomyces insectorum RCEF 264]|uniref:Metallophosphoesterase domain-containing protein n=1 Tax=Niveomyces insectorum RCEF 264 TaxID=1081102 RepID=A0A162MDF7_9HYPO|nr:metallophosphoesterase domain-containing protein [Niveomyces insectorum RCEF 264]
MISKPSISQPMISPPRKKHLEQCLALQLYDLVQGWQNDAAGSASPSPSLSLQPVTIVCLSDTHNTQPGVVPDGDILVHAGDLSQYGTYAELAAQIAWLRDLPHAHKIVVAGNHDLLLDRAFVEAHPDRELDGRRHQNKNSAYDLDWGDIKYLDHGAGDVVVRGRRVRVFGSPWTPRFGSWAFQYDMEPQNGSQNTGKSGNQKWEGAVPDGTDVVVSHGPPACHLDDGGKGCEKLLLELWRSRPALVVCGHIHAGRGTARLRYDAVQRSYEDAVLEGRPRWRRWTSLGRLVVCVAWYKVQQVLGRRTRANTAKKTTRLVNAAVVSGKGNRDHHSPIVVTLYVAPEGSPALQTFVA